MDNTNLRPMAMDATDQSDWRTTFKPDVRQKLVNKLMDILKKQLPVSVYSHEGLIEIATTFEEKMYTNATSQSDYLRKVSMTLLAMETKPQTTDTVNTEQSNSDGGVADTTNTKQSNSDGGVAQKAPNPAYQSMQSQELNQGQSRIPLLNQQSQAQQLMFQAQQQRVFQAFQAQQRLSQSMQSQVFNQGQSRIPLLNQQSQAQQLMFEIQQQRLFQAQQQAVSSRNGTIPDIPDIPNTTVQRISSLVSSLSIAHNSVASSISEGVPPNVSSLNLLMRGMHPSQQIALQQQLQQSQNPQFSYMQLRQLELQIKYFQRFQRYINQQMQNLQQQQQQFQQQQIPQLQQQFQQLTLQQQPVQLNGGAYNFPTTTATP